MNLRWLLFGLMLLMMGGLSAQTSNAVEEDPQTGIFYLKGTKTPAEGTFTVICTERVGTDQDSGNGVFLYPCISKGRLKNGQREGLWKGFHDNKRLGEEGYYLKGKRTGIWKSYNYDGSFQGTITYRDGQLIH